VLRSSGTIRVISIHIYQTADINEKRNACTERMVLLKYLKI